MRNVRFPAPMSCFCTAATSPHSSIPLPPCLPALFPACFRLIVSRRWLPDLVYTGLSSISRHTTNTASFSATTAGVCPTSWRPAWGNEVRNQAASHPAASCQIHTRALLAPGDRCLSFRAPRRRCPDFIPQHFSTHSQHQWAGASTHWGTVGTSGAGDEGRWLCGLHAR